MFYFFVKNLSRIVWTVFPSQLWYGVNIFSMPWLIAIFQRFLFAFSTWWSTRRVLLMWSFLPASVALTSWILFVPTTILFMLVGLSSMTSVEPLRQWQCSYGCCCSSPFIFDSDFKSSSTIFYFYFFAVLLSLLASPLFCKMPCGFITERWGGSTTTCLAACVGTDGCTETRHQ